MSSGKKKKYLTIEAWTDAFSIVASVLRQGSKGNSDLPEDLAIYMDLIRSIQKDGGDWYSYDVTFRKAKQADSSLYWRQMDQVLYSRALMKKLGGPSITTNFFRSHSFLRFCLKFNEGKPCTQIVNTHTSVPHALNHTQKSNAGEAEMINHPSTINPLHQVQNSHKVIGVNGFMLCRRQLMLINWLII